jgi:hypothetical protein
MKTKDYIEIKEAVWAVICENPGYFGLISEKYTNLREKVLDKLAAAVDDDDFTGIDLYTKLWHELDLRKGQ